MEVPEAEDDPGTATTTFCHIAWPPQRPPRPHHPHHQMLCSHCVQSLEDSASGDETTVVTGMKPTEVVEQLDRFIVGQATPFKSSLSRISFRPVAVNASTGSTSAHKHTHNAALTSVRAQADAKRAVAIALRNRWRRHRCVSVGSCVLQGMVVLLHCRETNHNAVRGVRPAREEV